MGKTLNKPVEDGRGGDFGGLGGQDNESEKRRKREWRCQSSVLALSVSFGNDDASVINCVCRRGWGGGVGRGGALVTVERG